MAAPSETESLHDNMTRIRMKMVQRKLANERERLNRPESSSSDSNGGGQFKLQQALIRRQQLLDKLKQEQSIEEQRARTCSPRPRRRYTASTIPPPSRRSLPADLLRSVSRAYHFNWYNNRPKEMIPNNYIIEHQYRQDPPIVTQREVLPQIVHLSAPPQPPPPPQQHILVAQPPPPPPPPPQQIVVAQPPPPCPPPAQITTIQAAPQVSYRTACPSIEVNNNQSFKKSDFMDMMMLQNAQMHHMVMQQMMLQNLPGSCKMPTAEVPLAPMRPAPAIMPMAAPPPPPPPPPPQPPVVHHMQTLPPLEPRYPMTTRVYNNAATFYDDGSNYFTYH